MRTAPKPTLDDPGLAARLRAGDEDAFSDLIDAYGPALRRLARCYVPNEMVASEVVQETWIGVIEGIERFEGRSSVKTWVFRILRNIARAHGVRERRSVNFSSASNQTDGDGEVSVDPDRFLDSEHPRWSGRWRSAPHTWERRPDEELVCRETMNVVADAIAALGRSQREVITLRDVEGWSGAEVCETLALSEVNQRVLLHRARTRVRAVLEHHFDHGR